MTEQRDRTRAPQEILDSLVLAAQASDWMNVARTWAQDGFDVVSEARWYAKRGVLSGAVSFASAANLSYEQRIALVGELAKEASDFISHKINPTPREVVSIGRAKAIVRISADFIKPASSEKVS